MLCKNGEWTSIIFWAPRKLVPLFFLMRKFILKFLFLDFFRYQKVQFSLRLMQVLWSLMHPENPLKRYHFKERIVFPSHHFSVNCWYCFGDISLKSIAFSSPPQIFSATCFQAKNCCNVWNAFFGRICPWKKLAGSFDLGGALGWCGEGDPTRKVLGKESSWQFEVTQVTGFILDQAVKLKPSI